MVEKEIENKLVRASPEECAKLVKKLVKEKTSPRKADVKDL